MKRAKCVRDEVIEEIRSGRRSLSQKAGHDPARLIEHLKTLNTKYRIQIRRFKAIQEKDKLQLK